MRPTKENGEVLREYVKLARKLAKLPTKREVERFICSMDRVNRLFKEPGDKRSGLTILKDLVLKTHPELQDIIIPQKLTFDDLNDYKLELEKKKQSKENKGTLDKLLTHDAIDRALENLSIKQIKPYKIPKRYEIKRALNLTLSDLHFGADILAKETGFEDYGVKEEARRFAEVIKQTIEYKPHYRKNTALYVNLAGDLIQHKLHDPQAAAPMSEQITRAIHLLSQGLAQLAENFSEVQVQCATGNHGRDLSRHHQRASQGKWDSVETVIYYSLKKILTPYKNMTFNIPKTPFNVYEVLGHKVFLTHGDTVLKPGNPGKNLNIANMENQINKINASLKDNDEIKVAIVGHTHCASVSNLNTGAILVTNGALPPSDDFTVSIGYLENRASQTLFEMTKEHAVGDIRFIRVGEKQDKDSSLDKIISPFGGFNE